MHSISFKDEDFKIIKLAAQQEEISFASFLKRATLEHIKESLEYQRLLDSGQMKPEDKPVSESINDFKEAVTQALLSINENNKATLKRIEAVLGKILYCQLYFNPVVPEEEQTERARLAKIRMKKVMENIEAEEKEKQ